MPIRVLIIGLLFCLAGASSLFDVLSGLFASSFNLNFGVFMLPVGIGLLRGKPSSLRWAKAWIKFGYALFAFLVIVANIFPDSASASWFGRDYNGPEAVPYLTMAVAGFTAGLIVIHRLLRSEVSQAFFEPDGEQGEDADREWVEGPQDV